MEHSYSQKSSRKGSESFGDTGRRTRKLTPKIHSE